MLIETQVGLLSMAAEEYHRNKDAVGHSSLVRIMRSPAHFQEYVTHPPEPTPAMAFGTAVHCAVLEPAAFASDYAVFDESQLEGSLQSLDDYKAAAAELGIKVGKMKKEEIKDAIKATDVESRFVFREDAIAKLYERQANPDTHPDDGHPVHSGKPLSSHRRFAFAGEWDG
jgi:hypothetical protein